MKKIIAKTTEVKATTPAPKKQAVKVQPDRWNRTYERWWMKPASVKDRQERGELIRYINSCAPGFHGAHKLSLKELNDVKLSIAVCQVNRLCYNKAA